MSDVASERLERLNLDDILARVERQQAETRKFVAEQGKLYAEQQKFAAEQGNLAAEREKMLIETLKIGRDRWLAPVIVLATVVGAFGGTFVAFASLMRR